MAPHQDDLAVGLEEAIKTTVVQLCKLGIVYQCELAIAGTVGVTIDRKRTILVHFDEKIDPCLPDSSLGSSLRTQLTEPFTINGTNTAMTSANASGGVGGMKGLMSLTSSPPQTMSMVGNYPDLSNLTSQTISSNNPKNEAYSQTLDTSIPISIDIDSDSDSLCELGFDDDVIEVDPSVMVRKKEVMWSGEVDSEEKHVKKCDVTSDLSDRLNIDEPQSSSLIANETEPTSSDLASKEPSAQVASVMPPPRLLVDKRLFLKKISTERPMKRTRLSAAKDARAAAAAAVAASPPGTAREHMGGGDGAAQTVTTDGKTPKQSGKQQLACEVCGKVFHTHCLIEAHLVEVHDIIFSVIHGEMREIMHFTCKHCSKKFRYQATLDKHEFLHVADKPWKCRFCNNTYCYEESLQIHMNAHTGVLDCLICQKMYSTRKNLQKHIVYMHEMRRVRTGSTPKKPRLLQPLEDHTFD